MLGNRIGHRDYSAAQLCDMINHAEKVLLFKNGSFFLHTKSGGISVETITKAYVTVLYLLRCKCEVIQILK